MALIDMQHVTKTFVVDRDWLGRPVRQLTAVHDISLSLDAGETVGLVGESGCGKSTLARTVLGLYPKTSGTILYKGNSVDDGATGHAFRRHVQMIFQDPYASLDPRMTVEDIVAEPLRNYHLERDRADLRRHVAALLEEVDMPAEAAQRYPHEFSGGQRQRIGIARALALSPECIFCDEPISALDVSVQVQIVNMLQRLQHERRLSYLFIAHDLAMVHHLSQRIGVMYLGRLVELGPSDALYHDPRHPYTQALIAAIPRPDPHYHRHDVLAGEVPSPLAPPPGCVFHPRCPHAQERCRKEVPLLRDLGGGRLAACHFAKRGDAV